MKRYLLSRSATKDIYEIWTYIAQDSIRQANRLRDRLQTHLQRLAEMPSLGSDASQYAPGLLSTTILKRYVVYFTRAKDGIVVVRILHGSRDHDALLGS